MTTKIKKMFSTYIKRQPLALHVHFWCAKVTKIELAKIFKDEYCNERKFPDLWYAMVASFPSEVNNLWRLPYTYIGRQSSSVVRINAIATLYMHVTDD